MREINILDVARKAGVSKSTVSRVLNEQPHVRKATSDLTALEVMAVLWQLGVPVPERVSVLGFDNIRQSGHTRPPLTTIDQSMERLGRSGARMLLELVEGHPLEQKQVTIEPELVARESCSKPN